MNRFLLLFGTALLVPGLFAVDMALTQGPGSWALSQTAFWGTPIANFVFWIGLAHAGTFFSAILLVLNARFQKRVALLAEISTVASLAVAAAFPLIHLGIPQRFYYLFPIGSARNFYVNVESPLVWDFVAIISYASLSFLYLALHLFASRNPGLEKFRKPFAWILFPLVLWVHTIVSMDFAVTLVPGWQGAYFPLYFIFGALFSGVALVQLLLEASGSRVRRIEELLLSFSWALVAFWVWEAIVKGVWHPQILVFGFLVPQILWLLKLRDKPIVRIAVSASVLFALWAERIALVQPEGAEWTWVDFGFLAFGVGLFCVAFAGIRIILEKRFPVAFGEASGSIAGNAGFAARPFAVSLAVGLLAGTAFFAYFVSNAPEFPLLRIVPVLFPLSAGVAGLVLSLSAAGEQWGIRRTFLVAFSGALILFALGGAVYRGAETRYDEALDSVCGDHALLADGPLPTEAVWESRCASCHGKDGRLNRKFVHEFYPMPQELSAARLDFLGEDSLVRVILDGRNYMKPFRARISEAEAHALYRYLRKLADSLSGGAR